MGRLGENIGNMVWWFWLVACRRLGLMLEVKRLFLVWGFGKKIWDHAFGREFTLVWKIFGEKKLGLCGREYFDSEKFIWGTCKFYN